MRLGQPHCTGPTPDNISRPHRSYDPQNLESPIKVLHSPSYIHAKPEHVSTKGQTAWQNATLNDVSNAKMFGGECIFVGYAAWGHEPNMLGLRLVLVHDRRPIDS